jgi:hypothetical protein
MTNEKKKIIVTEHKEADGYKSFRVIQIDEKGKRWPLKFFGYKEDEECKDDSERNTWDKAKAFAEATEYARAIATQKETERILLTFDIN